MSRSGLCAGLAALVVVGGVATAAAAARAGSGTLSNRLTVTLGAHSLRVTGHPHPGRIEITVRNPSDAAGEFSFQLLKPGVSAAQVLAALRTKGDAAAVKLLAGDSDTEGYAEPAIVGAHSSTTIVTTGAVRAGHYVAASFLPGANGKEQALTGRFAGFAIAGAAATATPAPVAGTITLADNRIVLPHGFTGSGAYAIANAGKRPHSFSLASLPASGSLQALFGCVMASFGHGKTIDSCPGRLIGGVDTLLPGATAYVVLHLQHGRYGYVSTDGNDFAAGLRGSLVVG
jgi:hypothetical protein